MNYTPALCMGPSLSPIDVYVDLAPGYGPGDPGGARAEVPAVVGGDAHPRRQALPGLRVGREELDDLAWTTGDGPTALFLGAVGWLRERLVLLPPGARRTQPVPRVGPRNASETIP